MARTIAWGLSPRRIAVFFAAGVLSAALAVCASANDAAGQAASFLFYGVGGRALAMGGAYYAISDDATGAYFNPAGLTQMQRKEITFMQSTLPSTAKYGYYGFAWPTQKGSVFAVSMTQLATSGFEQVNALFDPLSLEPTSVTSAGSFADTQKSMGLSWAKNVTESLGFGLTVKQVSRQLASASDSFYSMDVGILKTMGPFYRLGFGVQNVFAKPGGKAKTDDTLPVVVKVGNSFRFFKERLTLALDANKPMTGGLDMRFGGEYWLTRWFAFRFGLMGIPTVRETDFGIGFKLKSISIDIAQSIHTLGPATSMSGSFRFGRSKEDSSTVQVENFRKQGFDAFHAGDFSMATQKFNQALDAQPGNKQVETLLSRVMTVTTFVGQATGGEEVQTYVRKGVEQYVDGRDLRSSVNSLRYAFNKSPKDEKLLGLLNMVEKEAAMEITRKIDGPEQFTWVDQKIFDARQSVYDGKYDAAVRRSQDVLDLEPNNVTALEIMGSSFYMMEQRDKALAVWKRVLEIDPSNQAVKDFLQKIK